jgi:hypothetical protein
MDNYKIHSAMKRVIQVLTAVVLSSLTAFAQTTIIVQNGSSSATYATLDAALAAASAGSFIYLSGGNFTLSQPISQSNLSIIGAGHHPDSTAETGITAISSTITLHKGANNLYLDGLYITGDLSIPYNNRCDNVVVKRCNLNTLTSQGGHNKIYENDSVLSTNLTLWHSIIRGDINAGYMKNIIIKGCIITGQLQYCFGGLVENSIFLRNLGAGSYNFAQVRSTTFRNNIFRFTFNLDYGNYACWNPPCGSYNNIFVRNIFTADSGLVAIYTNSMVIQNNKYNATDLFINQSGNVFGYGQNYRITTTSPAKNYGTDGTDCGIYGTANPFKDGMVPINPHITEVNIAPATNASGQLQIQIKATAQEK